MMHLLITCKRCAWIERTFFFSRSIRLWSDGRAWRLMSVSWTPFARLHFHVTKSRLTFLFRRLLNFSSAGPSIFFFFFGFLATIPHLLASSNSSRKPLTNLGAVNSSALRLNERSQIVQPVWLLISPFAAGGPDKAIRWDERRRDEMTWRSNGTAQIFIIIFIDQEEPWREAPAVPSSTLVWSSFARS